MSIFSIDQSKCHQDGICASECPLALIDFQGKGSYPTPIAAAAELCINCGHCAAVCPHGALSLAAMPLEQMPPLRKELNISRQQAEQFLRGRRSIRAYKDKSIAQTELQRLIELARYAPSGHNRQPVHWLVLSGREQLNGLAAIVIEWMKYVIKEQPALAEMLHMDLVLAKWEAGKDPILRGAPHVLVAHGLKEERTAAQACTIALTYLELAAYSLGMGACWAGYFGAAAAVFPPLQKALGLPSGHLSFGAMMVGYPQVSYQRLPLRNPPVITWR